MTVIQGECETDNADTAKKPDPVLQYPYKACESHRALTQTQFGDLLYHCLTGAGINADNQGIFVIFERITYCIVDKTSDFVAVVVAAVMADFSRYWFMLTTSK